MEVVFLFPGSGDDGDGDGNWKVVIPCLAPFLLFTTSGKAGGVEACCNLLCLPILYANILPCLYLSRSISYGFPNMCLILNPLFP